MDIGGTYLSVDEFEQGGLSGSVGSYQGQPSVQVEAKLQVPVNPRGRFVVPEMKKMGGI